MTDVRQIAFEALLDSEEGKYDSVIISDVLDKYSYLPRQDRGFLKRLIEGVIERKITLDYVLDLYSSIPSVKMKKKIRTLLRMGTFQLLYMDTVADHAAVNETVKLAKKTCPKQLTGFVNAVMRNIARGKDDISWPLRDDLIRLYSITYSCPSWIVEKLINEQGEENAKTVLELSLSQRPVTARVNLSKTSVENVVAMGNARPAADLPCAVELSGYERIGDLPAVRDGLICVQDISSMLVCLAAGIKEGDTVIDLCAAPGGKTMHAADIVKDGKVLAFDISAERLKKVKENAKRCGFTNIRTDKLDAAEYNEELEALADVVIADVPCSGLGVMGRKGDIKYNITEESIASLCVLQKKILKNATRYVKPGGILMLCTCTVSKDENTGNMRYLTDEHGMTPESFYDIIPERLRAQSAKEGYLQLLGRGGLSDGFFICKLRK